MLCVYLGDVYVRAESPVYDPVSTNLQHRLVDIGEYDLTGLSYDSRETDAEIAGTTGEVKYLLAFSECA